MNAFMADDNDKWVNSGVKKRHIGRQNIRLTKFTKYQTSLCDEIILKWALLVVMIISSKEVSSELIWFVIMG